jgi:hypothetical protein
MFKNLTNHQLRILYEILMSFDAQSKKDGYHDFECLEFDWEKDYKNIKSELSDYVTSWNIGRK